MDPDEDSSSGSTVLAKSAIFFFFAIQGRANSCNRFVKVSVTCMVKIERSGGYMRVTYCL